MTEVSLQLLHYTGCNVTRPEIDNEIAGMNRKLTFKTLEMTGIKPEMTEFKPALTTVNRI